MAISRVLANAPAPVTSTGGSSVACSWTQATANGNLLIAALFQETTNPVQPTITTPAGWQLIRPKFGSREGVWLYYIPNSAPRSGSESFSSSGGGDMVLILAEYTGFAGGGLIDGTAQNSATSAVGDSGTYATTYTDELWLGAIETKQNAQSAPTNGFGTVGAAVSTNGTAGQRCSGGLYEKIVSATGSADVSCTLAGSNPWVGVLAALQQTGQSIIRPATIGDAASLGSPGYVTDLPTLIDSGVRLTPLTDSWGQSAGGAEWQKQYGGAAGLVSADSTGLYGISNDTVDANRVMEMRIPGFWRDFEIVGRFQWHEQPNGGEVTHGFDLRRDQSYGTDPRQGAFAVTHLYLELTKKTSPASMQIQAMDNLGNKTIPGGQGATPANGDRQVSWNWAIDAWFWFKVRVEGINPTRVRTKSWRDGVDNEPTDWYQDVTYDSTIQPQHGGAITVQMDQAGPTLGAYRHGFRDLLIIDLAPAADAERGGLGVTPDISSG